MWSTARFTPAGFLRLTSLSVCLLLLTVQQGNNVMAGAAAAATGAAMQAAPSSAGQWSGVDASWPRVPIHISVLPNGKLLFWGRDKQFGLDIGGSSEAFVWDPLYGSFTSVRNTRTNLFCSGHSFLPDGRLLVTGGHGIVTDPLGNPRREFEGVGERHTNIFDFRTNQWTAGPDMPDGRWYPYNVTLANGETVVMGGSFVTGWDGVNDRPTYEQNSFPDIIDVNGNLRSSATQDSNIRTRNYPFLHLAPNGKAFIATASADKKSRFFDPVTHLWNNAGNQTFDFHDVGTSVTYSQGRVLVVGGRTAGAFATSRAEVIDLSQSSPAWSEITPMNFPRMHFTSVLLPSGQVLVVGGTRCAGTNDLKDDPAMPPAQNCTDGAVQNPELWDPPSAQFPSGRWTVMARTDSQIARVYHSTALLLPDARVLVGGGGLPTAYGEFEGDPAPIAAFGHKNVEIFSPPYLFDPGQPDGKAKRPSIVRAPSRIAYGQPFDLVVGNIHASQLGQAVLVRLPSVTHGFNQDQRRVPLSFTANGEHRLTVTAPTGGLECPPGPYMLFVLTQSGTPSVAKVVRVAGNALDRESQSFPASSLNPDAMKGSVQVKTAQGSGWQVTNVPSWITITSQASGTGSGAVNFTMQNHTGLRPRIATMIIDGQAFTVFQGAEFADVPVGHIFHDFIGRLYARGITAGCCGGDTELRSFCPESNVTRWQMAVFLITALGVVPPSGQPNPFTDIMPSTPGYNHIIDLAKRGITAGCGSGIFCPDGVVSREQMAVFIELTIGVNAPPANSAQEFADVLNGHWAYDYINDFKRRGITGGCAFDPATGVRHYCPADPVTRGMMAAFIINGLAL